MQKKVELFSQHLRSHINDENIQLWAKSVDKLKFCRSLIAEKRFNDFEKSILSVTLSSLFEKKAEDRFTKYNIGDEVLIRKNGIKHLAKVIAKPCENQLVVLPDNSDHHQGLVFKRTKDPFFSRMEGKEFSRICPIPLISDKALNMSKGNGIGFKCRGIDHPSLASNHKEK